MAIGVGGHAIDAAHFHDIALAVQLLEQPGRAGLAIGDLIVRQDIGFGRGNGLVDGTTTMPLSAACLITGLSASRSDGLTMIALTPAEIRLRKSAICSAGPPLRLATITFETMPEASAWALIEQIISSRQPLPISVLETPTTNLSAAMAPLASASAETAESNER
jgi:hypothetical protein